MGKKREIINESRKTGRNKTWKVPIWEKGPWIAPENPLTPPGITALSRGSCSSCIRLCLTREWRKSGQWGKRYHSICWSVKPLLMLGNALWLLQTLHDKRIDLTLSWCVILDTRTVNISGCKNLTTEISYLFSTKLLQKWQKAEQYNRQKGCQLACFKMKISFG